MTEAGHLSHAKRALLERYLQGTAQMWKMPANIPRRSPDVVVPLSIYQEDIWARAQGTPENPPFFNESITIHRHGPLDVAVLEQSLSEIVRRHEAWRTTFDIWQGQPVQVIAPSPNKVSLSIVDLRELPVAMREPAALQAGEEQARIPFNLKVGPLVRTKLARLDDEDYRLFFTFHQIIVDGISVYNILPSELASTYDAFLHGTPSLPDLPIQYGDFAVWHRQWMQGKMAENQLNYWRKQLAGRLPATQWGNRVADLGLQSYGAIQPVTFPKRLSEDLRELSQQEGTTLFTVLLAAFNVLLRHYTGNNHITVGTLAPAGRKHAAVEKLLGYFLNPVALHTDLSGDPTFRTLLRQSRRVISESLSNDDVPIEWVLRDLKNGDRSSAAGLEIMISLAPTMPQMQSGWDMTPMDVNSGGSRWELYLELADRPSGLIGRAQYQPDVIAQGTIVEILTDLQSILQQVICNPDQRLSELDETWMNPEAR
jgi:surfactin family lipopeptide synthetase A